MVVWLGLMDGNPIAVLPAEGIYWVPLGPQGRQIGTLAGWLAGWQDGRLRVGLSSGRNSVCFCPLQFSLFELEKRIGKVVHARLDLDQAS